MAFHTYKIEHYGKTATGAYEEVGTELQDIISINMGLTLGEAADSFSFSIVNYDNYQYELLKIDDKVKIYGSMDGGTTYTLILDGIINNKTNSSTIDNKTISISGLNRLEKLFNSLVSTTGENVQRVASYWITHIIDQVNEFNKFGGTDREIKYIYKGLDQNGNVASPNTITETTKLISYVKGYEKAFKLIEELSQDEFTDDGQYIYYLNNQNYFYYKAKSSTITSELEYGDEIKSHRTQKGMYDIVNYIIMNCGKNAYGTSILQMDYDLESINKYGWKVKLISRESIANELRQQDQDNNYQPSYWDEGENFPNAYPYTTSWGETVADNGEYNTEFVNVCLEAGMEAIGALLNNTSGATNRVDTNMHPSFGYVLGDLHTLKIPDNWWSTPKQIRLDSINYTFNTEGWTTDLKFKEDTELTAT